MERQSVIFARVFLMNHGEVCNESLNERTLGVNLNELKKKDHSILVAGGPNKIEGIYGALKGGYANVLVTDQYTAQFLLDKN